MTFDSRIVAFMKCFLKCAYCLENKRKFSGIFYYQLKCFADTQHIPDFSISISQRTIKFILRIVKCHLNNTYENEYKNKYINNINRIIMRAVATCINQCVNSNKLYNLQ